MKNFIITSVLANAALFGLPSTPSVISGNGTFTTNGNAMTIDLTSDRTIVEWNSFSIDSGQSVRFNQNAATSAVLNRVTGSECSQIDGMLGSNGGVYLINPQGVIIGSSGDIATASFLASTLDVPNSEFLAGTDMTFSGSSLEAVENQGLIEAFDGDAVLIGYQISNTGQVTSTSAVALAAAKEVVYKPLDSDRIFITASVETPSGTGLDIDGKVRGKQAILQADGNIYSLAINVRGIVQALGKETEDGRVLLSSEAGKVRIGEYGQVSYSAKNSGNASVKILGKNIEILDNVTISSRCEMGGAKIFIGGGVSGLDPTIPNATTTTIGENTHIISSAQYEGNGGDVVIYSDVLTTYNGTVWAMGGIVSGNGATVEVSGKDDLFFTGLVDTTAPRGETGLLVIDPNNIFLTTSVANPVTGVCPNFSGGSGTSSMTIAVLQACLSTSNVLVSTTAGTGGSGDIISVSTVTLTSPGNNLTLFADRDIVLLTPFAFTDTTVGGATLSFIAGRNFQITAGDTLTVTDAANLTVTAGNTVAGGSILVQGNINTTDTLVNNFNALSSTSDMTIAPTGTGISTNGATTTIVTNYNIGRDFEVQDLCINPGMGAINVTTGGNLTLGGPFSFNPSRIGSRIGDVTCVVGGDLTLRAGIGSVDGAQIGFDSSSTITSNLIFDVVGNVLLQGGISGSSFALIGHGNVSTLGGTKTGNITFNSIGGDVTLTAGTSTDCFAQIGHRRGVSGAVTVTGNIQGSGPNGVVDIPGDLTVQSNSGSLAYALFGHGGDSEVEADVFTGTVGVRARNISVAGGSSTNIDSVAAIGYYARNTSGTFTISPSSVVRIICTNNMTAKADFANAFLGARVRTAGAGSATVSLATIDVQAGNDLSLIGHNPHTTTADQVVCGAFVDSGTASSNLSVTVGRNLLQNTLNGGTLLTPFTRIVNGNGVVDGFTETITVGNNASIIAGNGLANIEAIDTLIMNVTGNLLIVASVDDPASILANDDTSVIVGGVLTLLGSSIPEAATITTTAGTLNVSGGSILVSDLGGSIENTGVGATSVTGTVADIVVSEGARITAGGTLAVTAARDLQLCAIVHSGTNISSVGTAVISAGRNIELEGPLSCNITTTMGDLTLSAPSQLLVGINSSVLNTGGTTGFLSATGGNMVVENGGFIENLGTGATTLSTTSGAMNFLEGGFVRGAGTLTANSFGDINVTSLATGGSQMRSTGAITISSGGSIVLTGPLPVFIENDSGTLSAIANKNITINAGTRITNLGSGTLTLVVDNQAPAFPSVGDGSFTLAIGGSVGRIGGGLLRIFTAIRSQNSVEGTFNLNATTYVPGAFDVDTATEIWNTYFPSALGGAPFTIFYKEPFTVDPSTIAAPALPAASFELFYMFEHYYPYEAWVWKGCIFDRDAGESGAPPLPEKRPYIEGGGNSGGCYSLPGAKYL